MASHTTLGALFTAIANAIRAKTGGTEEIIADDFPTKIAEIETGADVSGVTASETDVRAGKVFVKADGTQAVGAVVVQNADAVIMGFNESAAFVNVTAGIYDQDVTKEVTLGTRIETGTFTPDADTTSVPMAFDGTVEKLVGFFAGCNDAKDTQYAIASMARTKSGFNVTSGYSSSKSEVIVFNGVAFTDSNNGVVVTYTGSTIKFKKGLTYNYVAAWQ